MLTTFLVSARQPPLAIRLAIASLRFVAGFTLLFALGGIITAIYYRSNSLGGLAVLGVLWFGTPALLCLVALRGIRRRRIAGYRGALFVNGGLAMLAGFGSLLVLSAGSIDLIMVAWSGALAVIAVANGAAAVGLLRPRAREWFGLSPLSWVR